VALTTFSTPFPSLQTNLVKLTYTSLPLSIGFISYLATDDAAALTHKLQKFHVLIDSHMQLEPLLARPIASGVLIFSLLPISPPNHPLPLPPASSLLSLPPFLSLDVSLLAGGKRWSVFLMVDCGYGRDGVDPTQQTSLDLALRIARSDRVTFAGIYTHGGHSYDAVGPDEIRKLSAQERDAVANFATKIREAGVTCPTVGVG
jgi:hypothetical protein